ncbi:hypothetical protein FHS85_001151 [Rhodoligotrophos appendicifer]|uniref:hypothetical protein n=1 Tax=Rhodoligotrophos appendicifer TaxID=987056 RepID=UPI001187294D|nr:hypothetical protein [Rhodoligotrophos appendicifer]
MMTKPSAPPTYKIDVMVRDQTDLAFPLVQALWPPMELTDWRGFCDLVFASGGILSGGRSLYVAVAPKGYIRGLCLVAVSRDPSQGDVLDVPILIISSAADEAGVTAELIDHLKAIAWGLDCRTLRLMTLSWEAVAQYLRNEPHEASSIQLLAVEPQNSGRSGHLPGEDIADAAHRLDERG